MPEVHPDESRIVREIFERVLRGDALTTIAIDLNRRGLRPRRGSAWTHTGISRLISSPALGGLLEVDGVLQAAAFEGALHADDWRAARAALRRRPKGEACRPRQSLSLLGGMLTCAEHGFTCVGGSATHGRTYVAGSPGQCHVSILRSAADEFVSAVVLKRLRLPDAAQLFASVANADDAEVETARLVSQRNDLAELVGEGLLTATAVRPKLQDIADKLAAIEAKRAPSGVDPRLLDDPAAVWAEMTMPARRELLRLLLASVTLRHAGPAGGPRADPTRVTVTWLRG